MWNVYYNLGVTMLVIHKLVKVPLTGQNVKVK